MPWNPEDAPRHTKKADTPKAKKQFAAVANDVLERTGDEGRAIATANGVVKKRAAKAKKAPPPPPMRGALRGTY